MSTLVAQTISNGTVSTSSANVIQGSAKAWVNFNGTNSTIRGSYNVSSVTNNATGDFTINYTNAFANTNYCWTITGQLNGTSNNDTGAYSSARNQGTNSWTTTGLRVLIMSNVNSSQENPLVCNVAIFSA